MKGVAKLEEVKRDAPPADKKIWLFAKVMNIQFVPQGDQLNGNVAGFRVRCKHRNRARQKERRREDGAGPLGVHP